MGQWRTVKAAVDGRHRESVSEPLRAGMAELRGYVDQLQSGWSRSCERNSRPARNNLVDGRIDQLVGAIVALCFDQTGSLTVSVVFRSANGHATLVGRYSGRAAFTAPKPLPAARRTGPNLSQSVLARALTLPLRAVLTSADAIISNVTSVEGTALEAVARASSSLLKDVARRWWTLTRCRMPRGQNATAICVAEGVHSGWRTYAASRLRSPRRPPTSFLQIGTIRANWPELDLPGLPDSPAVGAARQASARCRAAVASLESTFSNFDAVRNAVAVLKLDEICNGQPQRISTLISRLTAVAGYVRFQHSKSASRPRGTSTST